MARAVTGGPEIETKILDLIVSERDKALSLREWKFRLAGYGYAIKEVAGAQIVMSLPHGVELGILPAHTG